MRKRGSRLFILMCVADGVLGCGRASLSLRQPPRPDGGSDVVAPTDAAVASETALPASPDLPSSVDLSPPPDLASPADVDLSPSLADVRLPDLSPTPGPDLLPDLPVSKCGNGIFDQGEECDDGNTRSDDGCSSNCKIECNWLNCWPYPRPVICGDGVVAPGEECDDGNLVGGDGCSPLCQREPGWDCSGRTCQRLSSLDGGSVDGVTMDGRS